MSSFHSVAGNNHWSTVFPSGLSEELSDDQKERLLDSVAVQVSSQSIQEVRESLRLIESWILTYYHLYTTIRLTSIEEFLDAAYLVAPTAALFDPMLQARGWPTAEAQRPPSIGGTLASAEHASIMYKIINTVASIPDERKLTYFSELHTILQTNQH
jgi:hypothetical protein